MQHEKGVRCSAPATRFDHVEIVPAGDVRSVIFSDRSADQPKFDAIRRNEVMDNDEGKQVLDRAWIDILAVGKKLAGAQ